MLCVNVFRTVGVGGGGGGGGGGEGGGSVRAVNTSKVTSFSRASLHGSAQVELSRDQSAQRYLHL